MCPIEIIEPPQEIKPVATALPEWEMLDLMVDSGASETVMPEGAVKSVITKPNDASCRGVQYEVANGQRIPNLGEKVIAGETDFEGRRTNFTAQICEVSKPLMSVKRLVESGHSVHFDQEGGRITDQKTGKQIWLHEVNGMYHLRLWVPSAGF